MFWADDNTKYGYNIHPIGTATSGTHYYVGLDYGSEPWWDVNVNGTEGLSWHQATYATELQAGAEYLNGDNDSAYESGASRQLEWADLGNNWYSGWNPDDEWPSNGTDPPLTGFWYQSGTYYSTRTTNEGWSC